MESCWRSPKVKSPGRDPDDTDLEELGGGQSDLGLDPDDCEHDRPGKRQKTDCQFKEHARGAKRDRLSRD